MDIYQSNSDENYFKCNIFKIIYENEILKNTTLGGLIDLTELMLYMFIKDENKFCEILDLKLLDNYTEPELTDVMLVND